MAWHVELAGGAADGLSFEIEYPDPEIRVPMIHRPPFAAPVEGPTLIYKHSGLIRSGTLIYRYVQEVPA